MTVEEFKNKVLPVKNKLYRLAYRLMNSQADAEDVVQEVFLKLWSRKEKLNEYRSMEAFAMVMTKNLCFDKLKLKSRNQQELNEDKIELNSENPETHLEMKNTVSKIHEIIQELPEQQKLVIQLRDIEQCDFDEIAEITDMNLNTIRVTLSRARKKVRDTLLKLQNYEFSSN